MNVPLSHGEREHKNKRRLRSPLGQGPRQISAHNNTNGPTPASAGAFNRPRLGSTLVAGLRAVGISIVHSTDVSLSLSATPFYV